MLTYADGKEINKKQTWRQSGEMKGSLEGRRLEFSTSVTLAGLSIMCNVVEAERWSQSSHAGCLQNRSRVFLPWVRDGRTYIYVLKKKPNSNCELTVKVGCLVLGCGYLEFVLSSTWSFRFSVKRLYSSWIFMHFQRID